jgi:hypothetical protein
MCYTKLNPRIVSFGYGRAAQWYLRRKARSSRLVSAWRWGTVEESCVCGVSVLVGRDGMSSVGCRVQSFSLTALHKRSQSDRHRRVIESLNECTSEKGFLDFLISRRNLPRRNCHEAFPISSSLTVTSTSLFQSGLTCRNHRYVSQLVVRPNPI